VLRLQRSECDAIACNANVPQVPHDIAFNRAAIGNIHNEDQWELHSNDDETFMGVNDNKETANTETDKTIGIEKMMIVIMTMKCMTTIQTKVTAVTIIS